jgi:hypothetical protein
MIESNESRLYILAEQLQTEARTLQAQIASCYRIASAIKQTIVDNAVEVSA